MSADSVRPNVWGMYGAEANKTCNPNILFPHLIMQHNTPGTPDQQHNTPCVMLIYDHQGPTPLAQRMGIHVNHMRGAIRWVDFIFQKKLGSLSRKSPKNPIFLKFNSCVVICID